MPTYENAELTDAHRWDQALLQQGSLRTTCKTRTQFSEQECRLLTHDERVRGNRRAMIMVFTHDYDEVHKLAVRHFAIGQQRTESGFGFTYV